MRMPRIYRRILAVGAALTLGVVPTIMLAPAASASTVVNVSCVGTQTAHYSPGLTQTSRQVSVTVTDTFSSCLHVVDLSTTTMTGVYGPTTFTRTLGCTDLLATDSGTRLIRWSDGRTSLFTYTRTANTVSGNLTFVLSGTITSGLYAGAVATEVIALPALNGLAACDTPAGLSDLNGNVTLTITDTP